jgi:hypothetical protein
VLTLVLWVKRHLMTGQALLTWPYHTAADDMLCENPSTAVNYLAPGARVRSDHWKGMSQDEIYAIADTQAVQREAGP